MAVIKTGDISVFANDVRDELLEAIGNTGTGGAVGSNVALDALVLADRLLKMGDEATQTSSNPAGSFSWRTTQNAGSAFYMETAQGLVEDGWVENSSNKYTFTGSKLNGDQAKVTRLDFNSSEAFKKDVPGYFGTVNQSDRYSAAVDLSLHDLEQIKVGNFSISSTEKESRSGWGQDGLESGSYSSSASWNFKGSSTFDVVDGKYWVRGEDGDLIELEGHRAELNSSTIQSLSIKESWSYKDDGNRDMWPVNNQGSYEFSLTSDATGLQIKHGEEFDSVSGKLTGLTYGYKFTETIGKESTTHEAYVKFAGDFDLSMLESTESFLDELLKGNDTITATETDGSFLRGGEGNDRIIGNIGDDILEGEAGNDALLGGKGEDELYGGAGNDSLDGGEGDDTLMGEEGKDTLKGGAGHDYLDGGEDDDILDGGAGHDQLYGDGGSDRLDGGAGNDFLDGGDGNDTLKGGVGQDLLVGGEGADTLDGGAGNDVLIGGAGRDFLTGGTGRDAFVFDWGDSGDEELTLASLDVIRDFNVKQDVIAFVFPEGHDGDAYVLTKTDAPKLGQTNSYTELLAAANAQASESGRGLVVGYDSANAYVFADFDGDGAMDLAIQLVGVKGDSQVSNIVFESGGNYAFT